jgi:hypothetical protein
VTQWCDSVTMCHIKFIPQLAVLKMFFFVFLKFVGVIVHRLRSLCIVLSHDVKECHSVTIVTKMGVTYKKTALSTPSADKVSTIELSNYIARCKD